jgi:hypothetical protein
MLPIEATGRSPQRPAAVIAYVDRDGGVRRREARRIKRAGAASWSDFQAIGTDRWSGNRGKQGIQNGDLIQSDRNPL